MMRARRYASLARRSASRFSAPVEHDTSNDSEPSLVAMEAEIDRAADTARWIGAPLSGAFVRTR